MRQGDNDPVVYTWSGLRDPAEPERHTTNLVSRESGWKHFVVGSGHVLLRSHVFEEWLTRDLCKKLATAWDGCCSREQRHTWIREAGDKMAAVVSQSMNAPILLLFNRVGSAGGIRGEQWRLPLRNGARLIARRAGKHGALVTCYPPESTNRSLLFESHRWLAELRQTVSEYADLDANSGINKLPASTKRVARKDEVHTNIRFVKPRVWGFASGASGATWTPPDDYPPERADRMFPLEPRCRADQEARDEHA